jgi:hypothetical protein
MVVPYSPERIAQMDHIILVYHMYNQTLVNKLDPWLERADRSGVKIGPYREKIKRELCRRITVSCFKTYHPEYNPNYEPIAYNYKLVNPSRPTFSFDADTFRCVEAKNFTITGHSLSGALAGVMKSALSIGHYINAVTGSLYQLKNNPMLWA